MKLTPGRLNRATLARQLLLERQPLDVVSAVRRVVALQAQEPASPYLALWNRVAEFDADELHRAFAEQRVVKAQLMRITLHAVAADDYPAFHEAMQPTLHRARLGDPRFRSEGVSVEDAQALVPELLELTGRPRVNADVERWLEARFGAPKPRIWWALRQSGPFVHAATGEPWSFAARPAYVAARQQSRPDDPDASVRYLVRRYLEGFGPATMQDIAQFSTIVRPPVQAALRALDDELERHEGPSGEVLFDIPGGSLPDEASPAPPRLLGMWDSALLAYADRGRVIPAAYRTLVIRKNGDALPTLLVDGSVAGVWRTIDAGIEATAFHPLADEAWAGLDREARALRAFLSGREPKPYGRYAHWWSELPQAEVRLLGAG